jgi:hypothetical protein
MESDYSSISYHSPNTLMAFDVIEKAIKESTDDDLNLIIERLKNLYNQALEVEKTCKDVQIGSYNL